MKNITPLDFIFAVFVAPGIISIDWYRTEFLHQTWQLHNISFVLFFSICIILIIIFSIFIYFFKINLKKIFLCSIITLLFTFLTARELTIKYYWKKINVNIFTKNVEEIENIARENKFIFIVKPEYSLLLNDNSNNKEKFIELCKKNGIIIRK